MAVASTAPSCAPAGAAQLAARRALVERIGSLPTGQAAATDAGTMPARWVIHVVGPVYSTSEDRRELLASCYRRALAVADELGARSVAFPAVSAGIYGWPIDDAADVAVQTVAVHADGRSRTCASCCSTTRRSPSSSGPTASSAREPARADRPAGRRRARCVATGPTTSTRCSRRSRRAATTSARGCRGPTRSRDDTADVPARRRRRWDAGEEFGYLLVDAADERACSAAAGCTAGSDPTAWRSATGGGRRRAAAASSRRSAAALTDVAFTLPGIDRVEIHCDEANTASAAIPRRLGYRLDRIEDEPVTAPGEHGRTMIWVRQRRPIT